MDLHEIPVTKLLLPLYELFSCTYILNAFLFQDFHSDLIQQSLVFHETLPFVFVKLSTPSLCLSASPDAN